MLVQSLSWQISGFQYYILDSPTKRFKNKTRRAMFSLTAADNPVRLRRDHRATTSAGGALVVAVFGVRRVCRCLAAVVAASKRISF
eukprot:COSAG06_NODE_2485_length_6786_cov_3.510244_1_plen_86_part_00